MEGQGGSGEGFRRLAPGRVPDDENAEEDQQEPEDRSDQRDEGHDPQHKAEEDKKKAEKKGPTGGFVLSRVRHSRGGGKLGVPGLFAGPRLFFLSLLLFVFLLRHRWTRLVADEFFVGLVYPLLLSCFRARFSLGVGSCHFDVPSLDV